MTFETSQESLPEPARNWSTLTDEQLISAHRSETRIPGGGDALSELFCRYQPHIARWCIRFTQDRDSALDLAQEILFRAYRSLHTFRGEARFSTWLYVIARNQCSSALQKRAYQPAYVDSSAAESLPDTLTADVQDVLESEQLRSRVWQIVMGALSGTEARVMMMHYGEDVPLSDITRDLGLSNKSGAKAYIVSARRKLNSIVRQTGTSSGFASSSFGHERRFVNTLSNNCKFRNS
jgi:RNA polymerase sigma-70 factor (ECF subfamily)